MIPASQQTTSDGLAKTRQTRSGPDEISTASEKVCIGHRLSLAEYDDILKPATPARK